jgi:hypothetical protein
VVTARLAIQHKRQDRSSDQHRSCEIDLDRFAPMRKRHILDQAVVPVEPRIVHKDVDAPAEELGCPGDRCLDSVLVAHVGAEELASALKRGDLSHRCAGVLEIENGDVRAFSGEGPSNLAAEASGCAGDQHVLLRKAHGRKRFRHRL